MALYTPMPKNSSLIISNVIAQLRWQMGFSLNERLMLKRSEWNRLIAGKDLPLDLTLSTLDKLGLSLNSLRYGTINLEAVQKYLADETDYIPPHFMKAAYSSRRIGRVLFIIIHDYYGKDIQEDIMRVLQIGPDFFHEKNDQLTVSTTLYSEIYWLLKNFYQLTDQNIYWIGQKTSHYNSKTALSSQLNRNDLKETYGHFLEEVSRYVERSYNYQLTKLNNHEVIIKKTLSEEIQDTLGEKKYGKAEACTYSLGFISTAGFFSSQVFPVTKKLKCLYENNQHSLFHVDLKNFSSPSFFPSTQSRYL